MQEKPKQKPPKRQHVIPKCYLKRFAEQDMAWVIDTESDSKPHKTGLDNMLCIKDFYTTDGPEKEKSYAVEQWLNKGEGAIGNQGKVVLAVVL